MLAGPIDGTVRVLAELKDAGYELHALTNWSAEKFPIARDRYAFLTWFGTILVSGEHGLIKPDPRIFELLLGRIGHTAADASISTTTPGTSRRPRLSVSMPCASRAPSGCWRV